MSDRDFSTYDTCSLDEGSIPSLGTHRLLNFQTDVANVGADDLRIGNPAAHPEWFTWGTCHHHWHVPLAAYDLIDAAGNVVASGHKQGFCLIDSFLYDPSLARRSRPKYDDCAHGQGISSGWADSYTAGLSGQWIVLDGVPAGTYWLRIIVNYLGVLPEQNYSNNTTTVQVTVA